MSRVNHSGDGNGNKIAVGLSGGVDSALSAALLKEQGYDITGVFLECWNEPGCRTDKDRQDALKVALKLKIPFRVLDFKKEYRRRVMDLTYREFKKGRTPNPDILCNREIKFGLFLDWAGKHGFDFVATGHYAQVGLARPADVRRAQSLATPLDVPSGVSPDIFARRSAWPAPMHLLQSVDKDKDQTYFLAMLKEKQLRQVLFPIGYLLKSQVRQEAKKLGLHVWNKKDSTGICFIGHDLPFKDFLKRKIKSHQGEVVDKAGKIIGKHDGVEFYTIGQRHGFRAAAKTSASQPLFVIQKDIKSNRLIVGNKRDLARKEFEVETWSWISPVRSLQGRALKCRIRHQGRLVSVKIRGKKVVLKQVVDGVAPGQAAVVYCGQECLGGGIIS